MQQTIFELCGTDLNMLSELEAALERPTGDTLIQIRLLLGVFAFSSDGQHAIAQLNVQILLAEASDGKRDPIVSLIRALDVVGGKPLPASVACWSMSNRRSNPTVERK
jgi:hypothetical protein